MKLLLVFALSGYWTLSLCAPVPLMQHDDLEPSMDMDHTMHMWFHVSEHCTILFEQWHTMNYGELIGSAIALAVLAALYEGFKVLREELLQRMTPRTGSRANLTKVGSQDMTLAESVAAPLPLTICSSAHIIQALLHFVQVWVSYMLMLAFMTYNVVVCLFICFGAAMGYWAFAWRRSVIQDKNEHCH